MKFIPVSYKHHLISVMNLQLHLYMYFRNVGVHFKTPYHVYFQAISMLTCVTEQPGMLVQPCLHFLITVEI